MTNFKLQALSSSTYDELFGNHPLYRGWFSKNNLQKLEKGFYFINMASSDSINFPNGSHWTCLFNCYKRKPNTIIYMDPFGLPPPEIVLKRMKEETGKKMIFPDLSLQHMSSNACGYYTIFFVTELLRGRSISDIVLNLMDPTNPLKNEKILESWLKKISPKDIDSSMMQNFYQKLGKGTDTVLYDNYCHALVKIPARFLIIGQSGSGKTNALFSLLQNVNAFDRIYIFAKDIEEPLYLRLNECMKAIEQKLGVKIFSISDKATDIISVNELDKFRNNIVVFDDYVLADKKVQAQIAEFFIRARKKNTSVVYISQSYYRVDKVIRGNANYVILKSIASKKDVTLILKEMDIGVSADKLQNLYNHIQSKGMENFMMIDLTSPDKRFRINFKPVNIETFDSAESQKSQEEMADGRPKKTKSVSKIRFDTSRPMLSASVLDRVKNDVFETTIHGFEAALISGTDLSMRQSFLKLLGTHEGETSGLKIEHLNQLLDVMNQHRNYLVTQQEPIVTKDMYLANLAAIYNRLQPGNWRPILEHRVYAKQVVTWPIPEPIVNQPAAEVPANVAAEVPVKEIPEVPVPVATPVDFETKEPDEGVNENILRYAGSNLPADRQFVLFEQIQRSYLIKMLFNKGDIFTYEGMQIHTHNGGQYINAEDAHRMYVANHKNINSRFFSKGSVQDILKVNGLKPQRLTVKLMLEALTLSQRLQVFIVSGGELELERDTFVRLLGMYTDAKLREIQTLIGPGASGDDPIEDILSVFYVPLAMAGISDRKAVAGSGSKSDLIRTAGIAKRMLDQARESSNFNKIGELTKQYHNILELLNL